ncbi:hypothetical protein HZH68_016471 [Vespula germanica]|uniref:Uncharacterized protein n=2 Tax=Vespula TaxID=7451 RepID=A0A834J3T9_VESGE|nr:hypothetical protein HZH68_016471 [Vespula germanica]
MEKDNVRHYRAYEGFKPANNGNTSSLKRTTSEHPKTLHPSRQVRCLCFGGIPDKASQQSFLKGFAINLGICALMVAYTLLGSFIFLAIEGGTDSTDNVGIHRALATIAVSSQSNKRNTTAWLMQVNNEARAKTVENIWILTESLNILYRENWTRLAAQEIARFQDQLVKRITEDMMATQNTGTYTGSTGVNGDSVTERRIPEYEWNFAKAFLYSLTVLTTLVRDSRGSLKIQGRASIVFENLSDFGTDYQSRLDVVEFMLCKTKKREREKIWKGIICSSSSSSSSGNSSSSISSIVVVIVAIAK